MVAEGFHGKRGLVPLSPSVRLLNLSPPSPRRTRHRSVEVVLLELLEQLDPLHHRERARLPLRLRLDPLHLVDRVGHDRTVPHRLAHDARDHAPFEPPENDGLEER